MRRVFLKYLKSLQWIVNPQTVRMPNCRELTFPESFITLSVSEPFREEFLKHNQRLGMRYFKLIVLQKSEEMTEAGRQAGGRCVVGGSWWPQEAAGAPAGQMPGAQRRAVLRYVSELL